MKCHFKTLRPLHKKWLRKGNVRSANLLVSSNLYKKLTNLHKKLYIVYKEEKSEVSFFYLLYIYYITKIT